MLKTLSDVMHTIQSYLGNGGLFNPEMMEHDKVRDLILDCRDHLGRIPKLIEALQKSEAALTRAALILPPHLGNIDKAAFDVDEAIVVAKAVLSAALGGTEEGASVIPRSQLSMNDLEP